MSEHTAENGLPRDDFDGFLAEQMRDPSFARHYNEAKARMDRAEPVLCAWRNCVHDVDPMDGKIIGGMGPVACPCDHLPGWRSDRVEGQARPAAPVKARGRHGSRVQRSRKRHALGSWMDAFGGWLPANTSVIPPEEKWWVCEGPDHSNCDHEEQP